LAGCALDPIAFLFDYIEHQGEDFARIDESTAGVERFRPLPQSAKNFHLRWDEDTRDQILAFEFDPSLDQCTWLEGVPEVTPEYVDQSYVPLPRYEVAAWWPSFLREGIRLEELRESGLGLHRRFQAGPPGTERMSAFDVFYAVDCNAGRAFAWIDTSWCSCEKASTRDGKSGHAAPHP
jgi:hypothetical protein